MKNLVVKSRSVELVNGDNTIGLTLRPVTFARLNEISSVLGEDELVKVLLKPSSLDLCKIAYCLIDEESKARLSDIKIELDGKQEELNEAAKLYYFSSETSVTQGHANMKVLSATINELLADSTGATSKKKIMTELVLVALHLMWKSCLILLPILMVAILTLHLLKM